MKTLRSLKGFLLKQIMPPTSGDSGGESRKLLAGQVKLAILLVTAAFLLILLFFKSGSADAKKEQEAEAKEAKKIKVEVASSALDPEVMWRQHFEEKLESSKEETEKQILKFTENLTSSSEGALKDAQNELKALRGELEELREFAMNARAENEISANKADESFAKAVEANLIAEEIATDEPSISGPKDSSLYIPETAYITGSLLGGIAVSTSVGSSSEPIPVSIRITGRGNLPKKFAVELKDCRIMSSAYGDLSSERAIVRAEVLVCSNPVTEEIVTTKIAGQIFGDDGMNGIKGRVVDMSTKHLKNAVIGGMLSGFAGTMKSESQLSITSLGALTTGKTPLSERAKDNALEGMGNASEKIADYYIKQAEKMSPVLLIPGGTKVDIMFTKGVYVGSTDVVKKIENDRRRAER